MNSVEIVPSFILITVLIVGALWDLRFQKIPNWLTFPTVATAIVYHSRMNGFGGFIFSVEGIGVGILILLPLYILGGTGAGDVKLLGAVGGLLGPKGGFAAFLFTALVGGIYALVLLTFHGYMKEIVARYWLVFKTFILTRNLIYIPAPRGVKKPRLLYGLAIALGTLLSVGWASHIF
ncbi:MAG: A24 family peptidase [Deltaproteobacteria bacterium]|nr:A24 family peptidase [Deltaproteobacteria bacterium]